MRYFFFDIGKVGPVFFALCEPNFGDFLIKFSRSDIAKVTYAFVIGYKADFYGFCSISRR